MKKKKLPYYIFKNLSEHRLDEIAKSLDLVENGLKNKFQDWEEWYEKKTEGYSDDEKSNFIDWYYDDLAMIRDTAPNMARQAMCVCISGYFETFMADMCRFVYKAKLVPSEPRQKLYLEDSQKYLIDKASFCEKLFHCPEWEFCIKASYVRNAIVHYNGRVPNHLQGNLKKQVEIVKQFINDTEGISTTTFGDILIDIKYCELVMKNINKMTEIFFDAIERETGDNGAVEKGEIA